MNNLFALLISSLLLFTSNFTSSIGFQQPADCHLRKNDLPKIRTFKLGMSKSEVIRLYPKLGPKDRAWHQVDTNGYTEIIFEQNSSDNYLPEAEKKGLSNLKIAFLDDRVVKMKITYDGFTEWGNISRFLEAIISALKLPEASLWSKVTSQVSEIRRLSCGEIIAEVELFPRHSKYALEIPTLTITDADLEAELASRESGRKEKQRKAFKP